MESGWWTYRQRRLRWPVAAAAGAGAGKRFDYVPGCGEGSPEVGAQIPEWRDFPLTQDSSPRSVTAQAGGVRGGGAEGLESGVQLLREAHLRREAHPGSRHLA